MALPPADVVIFQAPQLLKVAGGRVLLPVAVRAGLLQEMVVVLVVSVNKALQQETIRVLAGLEDMRVRAVRAGLAALQEEPVLVVEAAVVEALTALVVWVRVVASAFLAKVQMVRVALQILQPLPLRAVRVLGELAPATAAEGVTLVLPELAQLGLFGQGLCVLSHQLVPAIFN